MIGSLMASGHDLQNCIIQISNRLEILRALSRKLAMDKEVDLMEVALQTEGLTGERLLERYTGCGKIRV